MRWKYELQKDEPLTLPRGLRANRGKALARSQFLWDDNGKVVVMENMPP